MSFIVQPVEAPSIFTTAQRVSAGAGGKIDFFLDYVDALLYVNNASANTILNITAGTGISLNSTMGNGDVAKIQFQLQNANTNFKLDYITIDSGAAAVELSLPGTLTSWTGYPSSVTSYDLEIIKKSNNSFLVESQINRLTIPSSSGVQVFNAVASLVSAGVSVSFSVSGTTTLDVGYQVVSSPSGVLATQSSGSPFLLTTNLGTGTFTYQIAAFNAAGVGPYSTASNAVTLNVPAAPTIGIASATTTSAVTVAFTPGSSGWVGANVSYSGISTPFTVNGTVSGQTMNFSGLTPGFQYTFNVRGANAAGTGQYSSASNTVDLGLTIQSLVIGGGGSGGGCSNNAQQQAAGGGGAGGYRSQTLTNILKNTDYTITVGAAGSQSVFASITAAAGGNGGSSSQASASPGANGGSGGGGGVNNFGNTTSGGAGNTPVTSPSQGNNGGDSGGVFGGGGGGAGATGNSGGSGGNGGVGTASSITGSSVTRAGGGGAGHGDNGSSTPTSGGTGGGGSGGVYNDSGGQVAAIAGTINTGGGGGGGGGREDQIGGSGRAGGSGIVIVRYATSLGAISGGTGLTYTTTTVSTDTVLTFTAGAGNIRWS